MPNWCENLIIIPDREDIIQDIKTKFVGQLNNDEIGRDMFLFDKIIPVPIELKDKDPKVLSDKEYDFRVKNWGTKWDGFINDIFGDGINFDTAWSPAEGIARELSRMHNCNLRIIFWEPGCSFGGITEYANGEKTSEEYYDFIDKENFYNISEELQDFIGKVFEWDKETEESFEHNLEEKQ